LLLRAPYYLVVKGTDETGKKTNKNSVNMAISAETFSSSQFWYFEIC